RRVVLLKRYIRAVAHEDHGRIRRRGIAEKPLVGCRRASESGARLAENRIAGPSQIPEDDAPIRPARREDELDEAELLGGFDKSATQQHDAISIHQLERGCATVTARSL